MSLIVAFQEFMRVIYITGDTHRKFARIERFCEENNTSREDLLIILGDVGLNMYGNERDSLLKKEVADLPISLFCIHGNHEKRPCEAGNYKEKDFFGGLVWYEEEYPNILFARDGDIYELGGYSCIVIGGAYSVAKPKFLSLGKPWFESEQPSPEIKACVEKQLANNNYRIDIVLSHTEPYKYEPRESFVPGPNESSIDKSTEKWLDSIEDSLKYRKWYCGHHHIIKKIDKLQFMFENIEKLEI